METDLYISIGENDKEMVAFTTAYIDNESAYTVSPSVIAVQFLRTDYANQTSISGAIQSSVATWYKALRKIALVGLLSVLVYIGIRIIISSSSAKDKAKYKNMLKDWLVAMCLLFVMHYIMAIFLGLNESFNNIFSDLYGKSDSLVMAIRDNCGTNYDDAVNNAGNVIAYVVILILTIMFTIQYFKRVVWMALLTMLAPLVALTYPLDKIKDSKAQAFTFWFKELAFNCLIQPVHLILYTILISNVVDFAKDHVVYALVTLGFLSVAEKVIKEMFGLSTETSTGKLGAAAGGAAMMNAFNKLKGKGDSGKKSSKGKGENSSKGAKGSENSGKVRTAEKKENKADDEDDDENSKLNTKNSEDKTNAELNTAEAVSKENNKKIKEAQKPGIARGALRGTGRVLKNGASSLKSSGKWAVKSLPGAILGAGVGLAATVASGGENGLGFITGGITAGSAMSRNLTDKVTNGVGTEFSKGYNGIDNYYAKQNTKQFLHSEEFQRIKENPNIDQTNIKKRTKELLDYGINGSNVQEALENDITANDFSEYANSKIDSAKDIRTLKDAGIDAEAMEKFHDAGVTNIDKLVKTKQAHPEMDEDELATMFKMAKVAPKSLKDFKTMYPDIDDNKARQMFSLLAEFAN